MSTDRRPRLLDGTRLLDSRLLAEHPRPRAIAVWRHAHWLAVGTVCLGAFLGQLTASITVLVFPALERGFQANFAAVEWVALSYLLVLVALLAPVGRLSDLVGRKTVYLGGFAVFALASLGAGFATDLAELVVCRAVQAVGGAMMQANSVALVARGVPERAMRTALGIQAAAQALGLALGPTLGGLLVAHASWRWVFWINVPIGVLGILAGWFLLPRTHPRGRPVRPVRQVGERLDGLAGRGGAVPVAAVRPVGGDGRISGEGRFDLLGLVLLAGSSTALLLALSVASGLPLPGWAAGGLLLLAAVLAVALARQEQHADRPIIAPGLVNTPGIRAGLLVALIGYLLLFCPLVLGPVLLVGEGLPAATAGLVITALPVAFAFAATLGGVLLPRRWSDAARCRCGALLAGLGLVLTVLTALPVLPVEPVFVTGCTLAGFGLGLLLPANNALVMRAIPAESSAVGGGMVNMVRSLGTALGTALPVLGVHLAGRAAGGTTVLLLLVAAAALAALLSKGAPAREAVRVPAPARTRANR
ncbi:MFS transporter [Kitasatospora sp. NPDC056138]|uniref:MFS transporter n=1 Tax=Kitasatospora sp. NPDC056138 TaxID=3345724 RepID=UPI0035D6DC6C